MREIKKHKKLKNVFECVERGLIENLKTDAERADAGPAKNRTFGLLYFSSIYIRSKSRSGLKLA